MNIKEEMGINKIEDFKDGTVFVLLGSEILGSEKLGTCSNYVYIKIGDRLLNDKGWIPIENYEGIDKNFEQKNTEKRYVNPLEFEIYEIYDFESEPSKLTNLDFNKIYDKTTHMIPIWSKMFFKITELELCDYFYQNFDIEIDIKKEEGECK